MNRTARGLLTPGTWGGRRLGAGRKPSQTTPGPPHRRRPEHNRNYPVHVILRAEDAAPSLSSIAVFRELYRAVSGYSSRAFRVLHLSSYSDHVSMMVEADSTQALRRGLRSLAIRCSRAVNRGSRRRGSVWKRRYAAHPLATAHQVLLALGDSLSRAWLRRPRTTLGRQALAHLQSTKRVHPSS